jgi:hypothetical protein
LCFEKEHLEGTLFEQAEQSRRRRIVEYLRVRKQRGAASR